MPTTYYPYDNGTVGPTGPEGPQGPAGSPGAPGVVQSVNGQSVTDVVLAASDVNALPSDANATLAASYMNIDKAPGSYRAYRWLSNGTSRWEAQVDDVTEAGSNTGSDFRLSARNDDGSYNATVIHAKRVDGKISFGTTVHHGTAQVTANGAVGLRDIGADPATASGGVFLYSKSGVMYVKQADGTSFQVSQISYPVTSVNGDTGNVTLGAADVHALPSDTNATLNSTRMNINYDAGTFRLYAIQSAGVDRWTIGTDGDIESGSDSGTNFRITARHDDGSYIATAMHVNRASGQVSLGTEGKHGSSTVTTGGAVGVKDIAADPDTASGGVYLYSKAGLPYIKQGDGTVFQVGTGGTGGGGAVDSVNGQTGIVDLDAADVGAIPVDQDASTSGSLTSAKGFRVNSTDINQNPIITDSPAGQAARLQVMRVDGVDKFSLGTNGDLNLAGGLTAGGTSTVPNLRVGAAGSFGGASGSVVAMADADVLPTSNPAGVILYSDAGVLKVRQADGTDIVVQNVDLDSLGGIPYSEKAAASGVASLDSSTKVPVAQLPDVAVPSAFTPESLGLKAWAGDPDFCASGFSYTGVGTGRMTAVYIDRTMTVSKVVWHMFGYAGGLLSGSWAGIYDASGARKAYTGDMSTSTYEPAQQHDLGGGWSSSPLTSSVTLAPGVYYVLWRWNYTASPVDGPALARFESGSACQSVMGVSNNVWRHASYSTSATSAPTSITVGSFERDSIRFWVGLA